MKSGFDRLFDLVSAVVVGYAFGTLTEMLLQGILLYSTGISGKLQIAWSIAWTAVAFAGTMMSERKATGAVHAH